MSNNSKKLDSDDLDIFEQELRGVNLEDTTFSHSSCQYDCSNQSNSLFSSSWTDDDENCLPSDPHEVFCTSQYRYMVGKELDAPDQYRRRYEIKPENEKHPAVAILELRDVWARSLKLEKDTLIGIVDVQPVFAEEDAAYFFVVNKYGGFVVVEPDILVSITSIMSQMWCERKSALSMFFGGSFQSIIMVKGTIAHDLIGRAIIDKITDEEQLMLIIEDCIISPAIMDAAYCCKLNRQELMNMAIELIPPVVDTVNKRVLNPREDQQVQIMDICDIEDSYWNPTFGLKGKLDATVKIRNNNGEVKTVPLEFKTGSQKNKGRNITRYEHNGQVSLYTLLMRPRYGINNEGLLLYIVEDSFKQCTTNIGELQSLICMRNTLATSITITKGRFEKLPRPGNMDFDRKCDSCEMKNTCAVMFRISPLGMSDQRTDTELKLGTSILHLSFEELDFYRQWLRVITLEVEEQNKTHSAMSLWKTTAKMREKRGLCICDLKFVNLSSDDEYSTPGMSRSYRLTLQKTDNQLLGKSLLSERDPIILSTQDELCISYGSIETINDKYITVNIERKLNARSSRKNTRFIIDKIPSTTALHSHYTYLSDLMEDTPEAERLRNYIIRLSPTIFGTITHKKVYEYQPIVSKYNYDQRRAIFKSLTTDSFLFVRGMPGTGKTETIVGLLRLLSSENSTVLLVAYTNNALDNILIKYRKYGKDFLRIGTPSKLNPAMLNPYSTNWLSKNVPHIDELTVAYNNKKIVASTLMGLRHDVFQVRTKFDYCIVDEASQALPTVVFGALKMASKYILFGDPDQLPAIIVSPTVKNLGIKDSMFTLMSNPRNTVLLSTQYRMNSVIMNLANKLVYENRMKCASEKQAEAFVELPTDVLRNFVHSIPCPKIRRWTSSVLSKQLLKSIVFLETTFDNAQEEKVGDSVRNINEASIVCRCVSSFITCGYLGGNIGIIAPFRGQVSLIKQRLDENGFVSVEVNTVDQYQGRDKDIIICSFTKSRSSSTSTNGFNKSSNVDTTDLETKVSILEDIRRLNVAITRAKKKLIMIGNRGTLIDFGPFKKLFPLLTKDQIVAVEKF